MLRSRAAGVRSGRLRGNQVETASHYVIEISCGERLTPGSSSRDESDHAGLSLKQGDTL
jgi:hypothetical protein